MAVDGWETSSLIARPGRWVGLVLLAAVVVIVVAVPPADGRLVAGRPQAAGLSAAPRPGQCLTVPLFDRGLADAAPVFPRFDGCGHGEALGEVVAVRIRSSAEPGPPPTGACHEAVAAYAGLRRTPAGYVPGRGAALADGVAWVYPFESDEQWVPQAPNLPAETSAWNACVASPPTTMQVGSLADAFAGGRLPAGYGRCWVARNPKPRDAVIACAWPHTAELLGVAAGPGPDDAGHVDASCRRLAAELLARPDPTVDGALLVRVGWGDPLESHPATTTYCYLVTADDRLVEGSFVGLGESAISYFGS
jgi:hypothetical protein